VTVSVSVESSIDDFPPTGVLFEAEIVGSAPYALWHAVVVPRLTEAELYSILERVLKTTGVGWEPGYRPGQVFLAPAYRVQAVTR